MRAYCIVPGCCRLQRAHHDTCVPCSQAHEASTYRPAFDELTRDWARATLEREKLSNADQA